MSRRDNAWRTEAALRHALQIRATGPLPFRIRSRSRWQRLRLILAGSVIAWLVVGGAIAFMLVMLASSASSADRDLFPTVAAFCAALSAVALVVNLLILRRHYGRYEDPGISLTLDEQGLLFAQRGQAAARYGWQQLSVQEILCVVIRGNCFFGGAVLRAPGFLLTLDNHGFPRGVMAAAIVVQRLVAIGHLGRPAEV